MLYERFQAVALLAQKYHNRNLNEAQTKTALIQPFIEALGYRVSDPFEIIAEFTADQGTKRGEKIDYAIMRDDTPSILIECKPCNDMLDAGKCSQLRRYFQAVPKAKIGILTNGVRYLFFSDRKLENLMDEKPFMEIDLLNFNERHIPELQRLSKDSFNIEEILHSAQTLQYFHELFFEFSAELENPSEDFTRFFCSKIYTKKLTTKALELFLPIFQQVIDAYIADRLNQRLKDAHKSPKSIITDNDDKSTIHTTNTEMWGLVIVRTLLHTLVDPARICMRDQKSYCSILLDDNNRKTICQFYNFVDWKNGDPNIGDNAYVVIYTGKNNGERFPLQYVDDLYALKDHFAKAVTSRMSKK